MFNNQRLATLCSFCGLFILCFLPACQQHSSKSNTYADSLVNVAVVKTPAPDTADYKMFQDISPQMPEGSKQISVSILQDVHLAGLEARMIYYPAYHAAELSLKSDDELFNPDGPELKHAILLIKRPDGTEIKRYQLGTPCARIDTAYFDEQKTHPAYILTEDYSTGMGSYNGPLSCFVRFTDTGMVNYNAGSGFATTLKSTWAIRYTNNNLEIYSKICRPCDSGDFCITTRKATWQSDSFKNESTVKNGFWEKEELDGEDALKALFNSF